MSWDLPWIKKPGAQGGFVIASVHQTKYEADITDTCRDAAYVCEKHADMILKAVNMHDELVAVLNRYRNAYPAFRIAPVGAEGSEKRIEQMHLMELEDCANAVLAKANADS